MFKLFRKYNKQILVVGGSILMVIFMIGPAATVLTPTPDPVLGVYEDGSEMKTSQARKSDQDLRVLRNLMQASSLNEDVADVLFESKNEQVKYLGQLMVEGNLGTAYEIAAIWAQTFRGAGDEALKAELKTEFAAAMEAFPKDEVTMAKTNFKAINDALQTGENAKIAEELGKFSTALFEAQTLRNRMGGNLNNANLIYGNRNDQKMQMLLKLADMMEVGSSAVESQRLINRMMITDSYVADTGMGERYPAVIEALMSYQRVMGVIVAMVAPSGRPLVEDRDFIKVFSIPERRHMIYDSGSPAVVDLMRIEVTQTQRDLVPDQSTNAAELEALFEKHKNEFRNPALPGKFGYRMPDALKFEVLELKLDDVMELVKDEVTELRAWSYYAERKDQYFQDYLTQLEEAHRLKYLKESQGGGTGAGDGLNSTTNADDSDETSPTTQPTTPTSLITTQPGTQPSIPEFNPPMPPTSLQEERQVYEYLREKIFADLHKALAIDKQREIIRFAQNMVREHQLQVPALMAGRIENGYYPTVQDTSKLITFESIEAAILKEFGVKTKHTNYGNQGFRNFEEISNSPDLGNSKVEALLPTGELVGISTAEYLQSIRELRMTEEQQEQVEEAFRAMAIDDASLGDMFLKAALADRFSMTFQQIYQLLSMNQQQAQQLAQQSGDFMPLLLNFMMGQSGYRDPFIYIRYESQRIADLVLSYYRQQSLIAARIMESARLYENIDLTDMFNEWAVQQYVVGPPASSEDNTIYLWRVNEVRQSMAPPSWGDVKAQLVRDLTELKAYEILKADAEKGLYSVSDLKQLQTEGSPAILPQTAYPFSARKTGNENPMQPVWADVFSNLQSVLKDGVKRGDETMNFDSFSDLIKAAEEQPFIARSLTTVYPSEDHLTVFVTHVKQFTPVSDQAYIVNRNLQDVTQRLESVDIRSIRELTSFESLQKRTGFKEVEQDDSDNQPSGPVGGGARSIF